MSDDAYARRMLGEYVRAVWVDGGGVAAAWRDMPPRKRAYASALVRRYGWPTRVAIEHAFVRLRRGRRVEWVHDYHSGDSVQCEVDGTNGEIREIGR